MSLTLRSFLYLDGELTGEFLAQLEGGRYSEEDQSRKGQRDLELGGGLGAAGVTAKAAKSSGSEAEASRTVRQTAESEFARLADFLNGANALQFLDALDEGIWAQIRRGEILEIEAEVLVSSLRKVAELAGSMGDMKKVAALAGEELELDAETEAGLGMISTLGAMNTKVPITARAAGTPEFQFIASLEPTKLRVPLDELDGEATFVAKVQRKLRPGEQHTFLDSIPGMSAIPREERKEAFEDLENSADFRVVRTYPVLGQVVLAAENYMADALAGTELVDQLLEGTAEPVLGLAATRREPRGNDLSELADRGRRRLHHLIVACLSDVRAATRALAPAHSRGLAQYRCTRSRASSTSRAWISSALMCISAARTATTHASCSTG